MPMLRRCPGLSLAAVIGAVGLLAGCGDTGPLADDAQPARCEEVYADIQRSIDSPAFQTGRSLELKVGGPEVADQTSILTGAVDLAHDRAVLNIDQPRSTAQVLFQGDDLYGRASEGDVWRHISSAQEVLPGPATDPSVPAELEPNGSLDPRSWLTFVQSTPPPPFDPACIDDTGNTEQLSMLWNTPSGGQIYRIGFDGERELTSMMGTRDGPGIMDITFGEPEAVESPS